MTMIISVPAAMIALAIAYIKLNPDASNLELVSIVVMVFAAVTAVFDIIYLIKDLKKRGLDTVLNYFISISGTILIFLGVYATYERGIPCFCLISIPGMLLLGLSYSGV